MQKLSWDLLRPPSPPGSLHVGGTPRHSDPTSACCFPWTFQEAVLALCSLSQSLDGSRGAQKPQRGACGSLLQSEPWGEVPPGIRHPSTRISRGEHVFKVTVPSRAHLALSTEESEACRHVVASAGPGGAADTPGGQREDGRSRRRDRARGIEGRGTEGGPSAHAYLKEAPGKLTSRKKAAHGLTICSRPSVSSGSGRRNACTTQNVQRRWVFISDGQPGARPRSPSACLQTLASPPTVRTAPRGLAGWPLCFSISSCVKEGGRWISPRSLGRIN